MTTNHQSQQLQSNKQSLSLEQLQKNHQNQIIKTFMRYEQLMHQTSPCTQLTKKSKRINDVRYYQIIQQKKRDMFMQAVDVNQRFLNQIIQFCEGQSRMNQVGSREDIAVSFSNFNKIKTTIKQFYREWSNQGQEVKDYQKIVEKAKQYLKKDQKVLAPGSGLGRLVLEFVQAGFGCQGNQVSYFMLYGSNFILNCIEEEKSYKIYPFISSTDYYYNEQDIFRSILIPDKAACKVVSEDSDFSMAAGSFTDVYNKMPEQFDGVATCFFIDTANNVFEYIDVIYKTLKPNGIWINYGPLLFHFREMYNEISIEVSWEILRQFIANRFEFLEEELQQTSYCHDHRSQMGMKYTCIMFVCRKK